MGETIGGLAQQFADRLAKRELQQVESSHGDDPSYPFLVVFCGEHSGEVFNDVASNLRELWPGYTSEMSFVLVDEPVCGSGSILRYGLEPQTAGPADIARHVGELFSSGVHYRYLTRLMVYFVLHVPTGVLWEEASRWLSVAKHFRANVLDSAIRTDDLMIWLIDDGLSNSRVSRAIQDGIGRSARNDGLAAPLLLLTNAKNDGRCSGDDWRDCHRIVSLTIAATNDQGLPAKGSLYRNRDILVASYGRVEKPLYDIGQVVSDQLVHDIEAVQAQDNAGLVTADYRAKLGLSKYGTITVIDEVIKNELASQLPTEHELLLFPRNGPIEIGNLESVGWDEFNRITLGSWRVIQDKIVSDALSNRTSRRSWSERYSSFVNERASAGELLWLAEHEADLRDLFVDEGVPKVVSGLLPATVYRMQLAISRDAEVRDMCIRVVMACAQDAHEAKVAIDALARSRKALFATSDPTLSKYYGALAHKYFALSSSFRHDVLGARSSDAIRKLIDTWTERLTDNEPIFQMRFDEELEFRHTDGGDGFDAKAHIAQRLSDTGTPIYIRRPLSLDAPLLSVVFLKKRTSLHSYLDSHMAGDTRFYDTANGGYASRLALYAVDGDALLSGGDAQ